jgi:hypothetical protein
MGCPSGGRSAKLTVCTMSQSLSGAWWTSVSEYTPASPSAPMSCSSWSMRSCSRPSSARRWRSARARSSAVASPASTMPWTMARSTPLRCVGPSARPSPQRRSPSPAMRSMRSIPRLAHDRTPRRCRIGARSTRPSAARRSRAPVLLARPGHRRRSVLVCSARRPARPGQQHAGGDRRRPDPGSGR